VDVERIRSVADSRRPGEAHILFVGLSREKKGGPDAAEAFVRVARRRPNVFLHLVGDGPFRPKIEKILRGTGVRSQCSFHGYVPVKEYLHLLGGADIVLAPSVTARDGDTEGGAPVTVVEAQIAGIPVIGTMHCDIPDVVEDGKTGLLCAEHDVAALARNLERLVDDGALRRTMGTAGAGRAEQRHDIRRQVEKIADVYESVVKNRRP
jgi:colanic acid/amylovoran biosynthesis glycosyltransferase